MSEQIVASEDVASETQTVPEMRRAQIVDAAVRLFSERGYFQTTIEDVANAVPVSKGLVYRYFRDKNDLLFYCMRYLFERYHLDEVPRLISEAGPLSTLIKVLNTHCVLAGEHVLEVVLAYKSTSDLSTEHRRQIKALESKIVRTIRQCIESCIRGGLIVNVNADIMAWQYLMFGHTWALKNWTFRDRYSYSEYMKEGQNILIRPFLTEAGLAEFNRINDAESLTETALSDTK